MPYIDQTRRIVLNVTHAPETPGELNYLISDLLAKFGDSSTGAELTRRIFRYIVRYTFSVGWNYKAINDVIGALECSRRELVRRGAYSPRSQVILQKIQTEFYDKHAAPYEDKAILRNGDLPSLQVFSEGG